MTALESMQPFDDVSPVVQPMGMAKPRSPYRVRAPDARSQRAPAPSPHRNHRNEAAEPPTVDNIVRF